MYTQYLCAFTSILAQLYAYRVIIADVCIFFTSVREKVLSYQETSNDHHGVTIQLSHPPYQRQLPLQPHYYPTRIQPSTTLQNSPPSDPLKPSGNRSSMASVTGLHMYMFRPNTQLGPLHNRPPVA